MTETVSGTFFAFRAEPYAPWLHPEEIDGLTNILMRADCYGGEGDIFLLCLEERNVLFRVTCGETTEKPMLLGLAFQPKQRQIWYYLPELIATLLRVFDTSDYMEYFNEEREFLFYTGQTQLTDALEWAEREEASLMRAVRVCAEKNAALLEPRSAAFSHLTPQLYAADGMTFYLYTIDNAPREGGVKQIPVPNSRTGRTPLYLKPHKLFSSWTLSDRRDKVKFSNIRESQGWNALDRRIRRIWGEED